MRRFALPTVAALLGAAFSAGLLRKGVILGPDSWAYWEGSVSLLEMHQYAYFGGEPVTTFPPLFSWALAAFQAVLGVSVRTLAVSLAAFVAAASFAWTALFAVLGRRPDALTFPHLLAAVYVPATLAIYAQTLLSEALWLALLPTFLVIALAPRRSSAFREALWWGLAWLVLSCLLLCRNVTIGLLPAVLLILTRRNPDQTLLRRLTIASLVITGALIPWYYIRRSLWQLGMHAMRNTPHGLWDLSKEMVVGLAYAFGPTRFGIGSVLLVAVCLPISWMIFHRTNSIGNRPEVAVAEFSVIGLIGTVGLFSMTYVGEPLAGRFVVFAALSMALVTISLSGSARKGSRQRALTAVGIVLTVVALYRVGVKYRLAGIEQPVEALNVTISSSYWWGPPKPSGPLLLVAPPTFAWHQRSGLR